MWFTLLRKIALLPWRALKALGRGVRAVFRALRSPAGRLTVQCIVTALVVAAGLGAGHYLVPSAGPAWSFGAEPEPEPEDPTLVLAPEDAPAAGLPAPTEPESDETDLAGGEEATDSPAEAAGGLLDWARSLEHLGIPERALLSYGRAEILSARQNPGCNLSWTTLAGIGQTETNHGTTDGNRITSDGTTLTPIVGPEHNEQGPMQFLEETWEDWQADGNADGVNDPHNIDDATTAAANYLCAGGRDLTDPSDWYDAVHSYNPIDSYVQKVYDRADDYGRKSAPQ